MRRFIITEEDRKHIKGLYEGLSCSEDERKVYTNLVTNVYPVQLKVAIKWWEDWLKNPITKDKFIKNYPDIQDHNKIYEGYFTLLSKITFTPYGKCSNSSGDKKHYMYVNTNSPTIIYVNTELSQDLETITESFVHEVQHLLYFYKPLNPDIKINQCFKPETYKKGIVYNMIKGLFNNPKKQINKGDEQINNISKDLNVPLESAKKIHKYIVDEIQNQIKKGQEGYIHDETESLSRIMSIRQRNNIKPGTNITKQFFMSYINQLITSKDYNQYWDYMNQKNTDVYWILLNWGARKFPPLDGVLNKMNQLAFNKTSGSENNIT